MIKIINADDIKQDFFQKQIDFGDTHKIVEGIIENVKQKGDNALKKYCLDFDKVSLDSFEIDQQDLKKAADALQASNPRLHSALVYSYNLALEFAKRQRECFFDFQAELVPGLMAGQKVVPVEKAGLYIPAGKFPLLSTVIMATTPARAAGVGEIVICTPPRNHPTTKGLPYADEGIMATAYFCGIKRVFACGGAQSIAAMAYGTQSIPKVDVIVGPGNKFVASAKKQVSGFVGIDMVAGPTEVFIIADETANPQWLAKDMIAQAEHDTVAQAVLATPSSSIAFSVAKEIEAQLKDLPTKDTATKSIESTSCIIVTKDLQQAAQFANQKAPEHLELALEPGYARDKIENSLKNYGSLFIGHYAAEVLGDYSAGLNHTLPTCGAAHFTGGLSVRCFLKTLTTLRVKKGEVGFQRSLKVANTLAQTEGLIGHAKAAQARM